MSLHSVLPFYLSLWYFVVAKDVLVKEGGVLCTSGTSVQSFTVGLATHLLLSLPHTLCYLVEIYFLLAMCTTMLLSVNTPLDYNIYMLFILCR